jgi:type IV fimbrial biogenesis protein FimT
MGRAQGISTTELIIVLAIGGILCSAAIPSMLQFREQQQSAIALNQVIGAVHFTRNAAITHRATVTLCPSADGVQCTVRDNWHLGAIAFVDTDGDGQRGDDEQLLRVFPALSGGGRIYWRSFRNRSYLQMTATGVTPWQNGHFLYCPADSDVRHARSIIVNAQGRIRTARAPSEDTIVRDAQGRPLACP